MTLDGHLKVGLVSALVITSYSAESIEITAMMAIAIFIGNVFPDFSEMGIIRHRTYTHFHLYYVIGILACIYVAPIYPSDYWVLFEMLCIGSLTHIACDWPYYSGIPLYKPKRKIPLFNLPFDGYANKIIEHGVVLSGILLFLHFSIK